MKSLGRILYISMLGLKMTFKSLFFKPKAAKASKSKGKVAAAHILLAALTLLGAPACLRAQQAANTLSASTLNRSSPPPLGQFHDLFSLADTGASPIEMHGIDSQHSTFFTLQQTHVVKAAKIHILYSFSPSLRPELSHMQLILNGTLFATIPIPPGQTPRTGGKLEEADFAIPAELLVRHNVLTMEFIGHYTLTCEDPANTTLWARVGTGTYLDFTGDILPLTDDLKQLPLPFLDTEVVDSPKIPVVFSSTPSLKTIQAAGIATSYFGMESENRPVRFPAFLGQLPTGNAIVISENTTSLPAGLNLGTVSGPTLAIRTNPNDPYSKVLIIAGADADQVVIAAQALAMHTALLQGATVTVDDFRLPTAPGPDIAPRWARTDGTIALWDYANAEALQGDGSAPLNVYFRVPPDIYYSDREPNAKLHTVYRYNPIPIGPISSIQVRVNNAFLGSLPLTPSSEASTIKKIDVPVPVVNLRPFSNSLSFDFTFQLLKKGGCSDTTPINMQGAILKDTYLDLRGYAHYAPLPNLEIFANAGFPFTRFADLAQTTVVLPALPSSQELEIFLTLMSHFGRQTGLPVFRVTVAGADALKADADTDFLVLGTGDDQPGFEKLSATLPVSVRGGQVQIKDTEGFFGLPHHAWWKIKGPEHSESGDLTASGTPDAVIEGIESPFKSGRSIVAINIKDPATYDHFLTNFLKVQQASDINGSVSILHGSLFQSFRIGGNVYHVGSLPLWTKLTAIFSEIPWLVVIVVAALSGLLAIWIRIWLRAHARKRLHLDDN